METACNDGLWYDEPTVHDTATEALHAAAIGIVHWFRDSTAYPCCRIQ
jgi:hypothetical protein